MTGRHEGLGGGRLPPRVRHGRLGYADRLGLLLVALLPLLPASSASGNERWLTPLAMTMLVGIGLFAMLRGADPSTLGLRHLTLVILVVTGSLSLTGVRVMMSDAPDEAPYLLARSFSWGAALVCLFWIRGSHPSPSQTLRALFVGGVMLSSLMIVVGVTGIDWFDSVLQARELGFRLPLYKTSGVWRSYGEVGIILSVTLAYLLTHRVGGSRLLTGTLVGLVVFAALVSQSRNVYLALLFVLGLRVLGTGSMFARAARASVLLAFLLPVAVSVSLPMLSRLDVTSALIGGGIYEENVYAREALRADAIRWMVQHPADSALGVGHASWLRRQWLDGNLESGLHNHFLANLVHHGWVVGGMATVILYAWPLMLIAGRLTEHARAGRREIDPHLRATFLAGVGCIACLGFYEGWFSAPWTVLTAVIWSAAYLVPRPQRAQLRPRLEASGRMHSASPNPIATGTT